LIKKNIVLIGFMGVGKGTVARAIVKNSDYFAVDTDDLIESIENKKIKKIFEKLTYIEVSSSLVPYALWCEKNLKGTIISTGGGFYRQENIQEIGLVVYLESSFDRIIQSLKAAPNSKQKFKKRPLLKDLDEARKLHKQRVKEYEKVANITINVEDWDIKRVVKDILKVVK